MLEESLNELAQKICRKQGYKTPYELFVKPELPLDSKGRDRILLIKAGNPPIIFISQVYVQACFVKGTKDIPSLRDTLERALEFLPKMHHTLSLVPIADAVALRKDSRRWARAAVPELKTRIPEKFIKITNVSVTVEDEITGTSITRNGVDYQDVCRKAKADLGRMITANEEMEDWRDMVEEANRVRGTGVNPNEVSLTIGDSKVETHLEY